MEPHPSGFSAVRLRRYAAMAPHSAAKLLRARLARFNRGMAV